MARKIAEKPADVIAVPDDTPTDAAPIEQPAPAKLADSKVEGPPKIKTLVTLTERTDLYLELYSRKNRLDRSTVIERALQPILKGIRVSFPDTSIPQSSEAA